MTYIIFLNIRNIAFKKNNICICILELIIVLSILKADLFLKRIKVF